MPCDTYSKKFTRFCQTKYNTSALLSSKKKKKNSFKTRDLTLQRYRRQHRDFYNKSQMPRPMTLWWCSTTSDDDQGTRWEEKKEEVNKKYFFSCFFGRRWRWSVYSLKLCKMEQKYWMVGNGSLGGRELVGYRSL